MASPGTAGLSHVRTVLFAPSPEGKEGFSAFLCKWLRPLHPRACAGNMQGFRALSGIFCETPGAVPLLYPQNATTPRVESCQMAPHAHIRNASPQSPVTPCSLFRSMAFPVSEFSPTAMSASTAGGDKPERCGYGS